MKKGFEMRAVSRIVAGRLYRPVTMVSTAKLVVRHLNSPLARHVGRPGSSMYWLFGGLASAIGALSMQTATVCDASAAKKLGRIALVQLSVTSEKTKNIKAAEDAINNATGGGKVDFVSLPECWNSPYATSAFPVYAEPVPSVGDAAVGSEKESPSSAMLIKAAKKHGIYLIGGSIPEREVGSDGTERIYNTCICVSPEGVVVAKHRKVHLFDIDVPGKITFKESDTLTAGASTSTFSTPFGKVGVAICYDIRFPELAMLMRQEDCVMLVYPGAFNMTTGPAHWNLLQRARAVDNQLYVAAVSPARSPNKEDYQAWGHSSVISPWGETLVEADGDNQGQQVLFCDLDFSKVDEFRTNVPTALQKRPDLYTFSATK